MSASVPTHQYSTLSLVPRNRECFKTRDTSIGLFWNADDGLIGMQMIECVDLRNTVQHNIYMMYIFFLTY